MDTPEGVLTLPSLASSAPRSSTPSLHRHLSACQLSFTHALNSLSTAGRRERGETHAQGQGLDGGARALLRRVRAHAVVGPRVERRRGGGGVLAPVAGLRGRLAARAHRAAPVPGAREPAGAVPPRRREEQWQCWCAHEHTVGVLAPRGLGLRVAGWGYGLGG